jgi:uncharacterized protein (TIGR03437 family)
VPVLPLQPAIYTSDGTQAIVVRAADNTLVTSERPLRAGELAYFYASGLGAVANAPADGAGGPISPLATARADVRVTLGGVPCDVLYAGLAPGLAGVYQVNIRPVSGFGASSQPLKVIAGGVESPAAQVYAQ